MGIFLPNMHTQNNYNGPFWTTVHQQNWYEQIPRNRQSTGALNQKEVENIKRLKQ